MWPTVVVLSRVLGPAYAKTGDILGPIYSPLLA